MLNNFFDRLINAFLVLFFRVTALVIAGLISALSVGFSYTAYMTYLYPKIEDSKLEVDMKRWYFEQYRGELKYDDLSKKQDSE